MTDSQLPEDTHLAYTVSHEAWYAKTPGVIDGPSVSVAASAEGRGGGVAWEFAVEEASFTDSSGKHPISVRLFDDAFAAFAQIPEFFAALAANNIDTLDKAVLLLQHLGAIDETKREQSAP